ncbi:MAG: type II secretion system ATPase GspE [Deltaproteobacteria bacterium]|nr:type II secretion system ATPase GspE [Deltaproteobacteria bacterium]
MARRIGEILIAHGACDQEAVDKALETQREKGGLLGEILLKQKAVGDDAVQKALAEQFDLEFIDVIDAQNVDAHLLTMIPITYAKAHLVLPLRRDDDEIVVACANPLDYEVLDDLRLYLDGEIRPVLSTQGMVFDTINLVYDRARETSDEVLGDLEEEGGPETFDLEEMIDIIDATDEDAPIIRLINHLMYRSVKERASDIHFEVFENDLIVRFRIDGVLYEVMRPPKRLHNAIASRVKIMAKLNIAEKRIPQDGRIRIKIAGKDIDIRTSIIPTAYGERVVMRLLDKSQVRLDLESLGLDGPRLSVVNNLIHRAHGIILVTGPTGSGKTTTLYASLVRLNKPDVNILTVEDPIEYQIQGIGQMQVNPKIDLTFASGLRSFLRQDPDIILVGEIRDLETAEIAIQASLTGHLVFSTLHTNDSASAFTRLVDMGVEPFLVSSSLVGVIAQRLVRVLCDDCKEAYDPTEEELGKIGLTPKDVNGQLYRPVGCAACIQTGYADRTAIYEILVMRENIQQLILANADANAIKREAIKNGMATLRMDGARRVIQGDTSIEEVMRVTSEDFQ